jgi:hypothetical protein
VFELTHCQGGLLEVAHIFALRFSPVQVICIVIMAINGLGYISGDCFINSSGHTCYLKVSQVVCTFSSSSMYIVGIYSSSIE